MSYATPTDLANLSLPAGTLTSIAPADQQSAIDAASSLADGYLQAQYTLPLRSWGADLTRAVCNVAAYDLMIRRGYNPEAGPDTNIRSRYDDAIKWLTQVAQGAVSPVLVDSSPGWMPPPFVHSNPPRGW